MSTVPSARSSLDSVITRWPNTTDIQAAHAARMPVIAFADKPGKIEAFAPYEPDVITEMPAIHRALAQVT